MFGTLVKRCKEVLLVHFRTDLTQTQLHAVLFYDQKTGLFYRKSRAAKPAGGIDTWGYRQIRIHGTLYMASRLAWLYVRGSWPTRQIDHINNDRLDDRFDNLREASQSENTCNQRRRIDNTSGIKGVSPLRGKWQATICKAGNQQYLGIFSTKEAAREAYLRAAKILHGDFVNPECLV